MEHEQHLVCVHVIPLVLGMFEMFIAFRFPPFSPFTICDSTRFHNGGLLVLKTVRTDIALSFMSSYLLSTRV